MIITKPNTFLRILTTLLFLLPVMVVAQSVVAEHGMVASANPLATSAGVEILKMGGNAADAAVAVAFTLGVVEPNASGIGGGGFLLYSDASDGEVYMLDFRETAPASFKPEMLYGKDGDGVLKNNSSILAVGVPGTVSGLLALHRKEGVLSLEEDLKPAIKYAEEEFEVSEKFADMIMSNYDKISANENTAHHYLIDELPPMPGEQLKNLELAAAYREIAKKGSKAFYRGKISKSITHVSQEHDGLLTRKDLRRYKTQNKVPVQGRYRGYEIFSSTAPAGGIQIIQLLNILEGYDLSNYTQMDPSYLHLLAEAMKMVYVDKSATMGDPDFVHVPVGELTSEAHADKLRQRINPEHARFDYTYSQTLEPESGSTTHFSIVDEDGNMVALTQSINHWFGTGITDNHYGVLLNDHLKDFAKDPNSPNALEPKKRPASSLAPTLIFKDGKPYLTIGTPGATRIISALVQIIVNVIDFGMDIDAAIEAPRIHAMGDKLYAEKRFSVEVFDSLRAKGHTLEIKGEFDNYFGGAQGILIDPVNGTLRGGADSRRDGNAEGY